MNSGRQKISDEYFFSAASLDPLGEQHRQRGYFHHDDFIFTALSAPAAVLCSLASISGGHFGLLARLPVRGRPPSPSSVTHRAGFQVPTLNRTTHPLSRAHPMAAATPRAVLLDIGMLHVCFLCLRPVLLCVLCCVVLCCAMYPFLSSIPVVNPSRAEHQLADTVRLHPQRAPCVPSHSSRMSS